jgi:hypothetical protein
MDDHHFGYYITTLKKALMNTVNLDIVNRCEEEDMDQ